MMKTEATFEIEQQYWEQGIELLAGLDEAGMGALAGPVTAAAVTLDRRILNFKLKISNAVIRDSKTLSAKQRERAFGWIKENCLAWGIGEASVEEISRLNIRGASHLAMRRAIEAMETRPEMLIIDGTPAQVHGSIPAVNVIDGDAKSLSIAAASILAKVYRDRIMVKLDEKYPGYGLNSNKGYGAKQHMEALVGLGATPCHRPTYAPVAKVLVERVG